MTADTHPSKSGGDRQSRWGLAPSVAGATGLPLVELTLDTDGAWSARFWDPTDHENTGRRRLGDHLAVPYNGAVLLP